MGAVIGSGEGRGEGDGVGEGEGDGGDVGVWGGGEAEVREIAGGGRRESLRRGAELLWLGGYWVLGDGGGWVWRWGARFLWWLSMHVVDEGRVDGKEWVSFFSLSKTA